MGDSRNISINDINEFFKAHGAYNGVDGVMFQDIAKNPHYWIVKEFQFRKRIQLGVYNPNIITNFAFHFEGQ